MTEYLRIYARGLVGMVVTGLVVFVLFVLFVVASARGGEADILPIPAVTIRPGAKTTGIAELDSLLIEAKRTGVPVAKLFIEEDRPQWFRATPDGWLSRIKPPVERPQARPVAVPVPVQPAPVREVRAPEVFREQLSRVRIPGFAMECEYDPDHVCNKCGRVQLVIDHWNRDGTHTHVCPRCRHSWRHRN